MDKILTLEEVASLLKVSERTVVDWVSKGDIPGGKIGTTWRFQESEINEWLNSKLRPRIRKDLSVYNSLSMLLRVNRIHLYNASGKNEILHDLINNLTETEKLSNKNELSNAIFNREEIMSTGIGLGIAVPHCRLNSIKDIYLSMGVNKQPISDYESIDGLPVQILIMIVAGRNQHTEYIKVLSLFSKVLKDQDIRNRVLASETPQDVYSVMTSGENHD